MTEPSQTTPTDAELDGLIATYLKRMYPQDNQPRYERAIMRAVLAKWGTPAGAGAPVAPDFYTACAWYEGGGEAGWIPLPGYSNETEHGVGHLVLEAARKEGYKGTAAGRLLELGWEIRPVYLTPQPAQTQAVPMTCEWVHDDCDIFWETACGEAWRFDDGGPKENNVRFCQGCGKPVHIKQGGQHGTE